MAERCVYVLHSITLTTAAAEPFILCVTPNESIAYQQGCKKMMEELMREHGSPTKMKTDDDLDDDKMFVGQKIIAAQEVYSNTERFPADHAQAGKLKNNWMSRYRRIENIYDKLRPDNNGGPVVGTYYYVTKQKLE